MQAELFSKTTQGIDLHCHTTFSDGSLSPEELILLAEEYEISTLAISDHDSVAVHEYINQSDIKTKINLIPAIELSCRWHHDKQRLAKGEGMTLHIVGLNIDIENLALKKHIHLTQTARNERNEKIIQRMLKKGWHDVVALVENEHSLTRTHFAKAMLKTEKVTNYAQAFRKYLGQGKPLSTRTNWQDLQTTITAIHAAGGAAVLAHPLHYKLTRKKLLQLCTEFKMHGGDAIEVVSGNTLKTDIDNLTGIALRNDLKASVGSDFHGPERYKARLGVEQDIAKTLTPVWQEWT